MFVISCFVDLVCGMFVLNCLVVGCVCELLLIALVLLFTWYADGLFFVALVLRLWMLFSVEVVYCLLLCVCGCVDVCVVG